MRERPRASGSDKARVTLRSASRPEFSTRLLLALLTPDGRFLFATAGILPSADGTAAGSESLSHCGDAPELRTGRKPKLLKL